MIDKIEKLKQKKNAVVIAHNYVGSEIKEIADVVTGSLGLIRAGMNTDADIIVVCGVDFMVENIAILNQDKVVLSPVKKAICPLAQKITPNILLEAKRENPTAHTLIYMNSSAKVKALADCVCTADNAVKIASTLDEGRPILFGPDYCLSYYVQERTPHEIINVPSNSFCPVHHKITNKDVMDAKKIHLDAEVVGHPECRPDVQDCADFLGSSTETVEHCKNTEANVFLVADEVGSTDSLKVAIPHKSFHSIAKPMVCPGMKKAKISDVLNVLESEKNRFVVSPDIAMDAKVAIDRMFELS